MTLGRNDGAVTVSFVDGVTLEGTIGHTGILQECKILVLWYIYKNVKSIIVGLQCHAARKLAYLYRLPTNEHRLKVGLSWFAKSAVDAIASVQDSLTKLVSSST